jgi:hypothetical protein
MKQLPIMRMPVFGNPLNANAVLCVVPDNCMAIGVPAKVSPR